MRAGGSNEKGGRFERKICVSLSLWLSKGERKDLFWRTSMSGGRATLALRADDKLEAQSGDISAISQLGHSLVDRYIIECKHRKDLQLGHALAGRKGNLIMFWENHKRLCAQYSKWPMLIARQNHMPVLLGVDLRGAAMFRTRSLRPTAVIAAHDLYVFDFLDFLALAQPQALRLN